MKERTNLSHNEVKAFEKVGFVSINNNLSFLETCLLGRALFQLIDWLIQCHGHGMGSMFDAHNHLRCQNYTIIGGRLVDFLWPFSSHHWRFVFLVMDELKRFDVIKLQIKDNIKL